MDGRGANLYMFLGKMCMEQNADMYSPEDNERQVRKVHRQRKSCCEDALLATKHRHLLMRGWEQHNSKSSFYCIIFPRGFQ